MVLLLLRVIIIIIFCLEGGGVTGNNLREDAMTRYIRSP